MFNQNAAEIRFRPVHFQFVLEEHSYMSDIQIGAIPDAEGSFRPLRWVIFTSRTNSRDERY